MKLTVRNESDMADALYRQARQAEIEWARAVAEETATAGGLRFFNPALADTPEANCLLDADPGVDVVDRPQCIHFTASVDRFPGYQRVEQMLMRWDSRPPTAPAPEGIALVPARAAIQPYRRLAEVAGESPDAAELHLDDPRLDAWVGLDRGRAVARFGLLAAGDAATLRTLSVAPDRRRLGIGRAMAIRAYELAQRSGYRHVLSVTSNAQHAATIGFRAIGPFVTFSKIPLSRI